MRALRIAFSTLLFALAIVALAAFPVLLEVRGGRIILDIPRAASVVSSWAAGLLDGSAWTFHHGATAWSFPAVAPKFAMVTFLYLLIPGAIGLCAGFFLGLAGESAKRSPARGIFSAALDTVFAIPDFILAVLLQVLVVLSLDLLGVRTFKVSYDSRSGLLLALPLFVMAVYPFVYSFRAVKRSALRASGSYYALNAKARGVPALAIRYKHVGSAALSSLASDLPSIMAIMMTSIFVAEYTFTLPGLTRWLFTAAFSGRRVGWFESYQYQLAVNILFCIAAAYLVALAAFRGLLAAIKWAVVHAL